jgi:hypothetical protein
VDLSPYTNAQCVLIEFESQNQHRNGGLGAQYIDRIFITSNQDLALSEIIVTPKITTCDLENKDVYVVVSAATNHNIYLSQYPTSVALEIPGYPTVYHQLQDTMYGFTSDTIRIANGINFTTGTHTVRAYLTASIDGNPSNDTVRKILYINPDIEIQAIPVTGGTAYTDCIARKTKVSQKVVITNKGSHDVFDIPLVLEIYGLSSSDTKVDTLKGLLQTGTSREHFFANYDVPDEDIYSVRAIAELTCDIEPSNNRHNILECVDWNDIEVVEIISPNNPPPDNVGDAVSLAVKVKNNNPRTAVTNIKIHAIVNNVPLTVGTIPNLAPDDTTTYTFTPSYTVPAVPQYDIKVFVENKDSYPYNDTITSTRQTNVGIPTFNGAGFALGQNIPNPAKDNTRIDYSIPADGQVIFTVYTVTGQALHSEKRDTHSGKNSIEFNTINLANGIYYYSMEYKGERLVKKMTIRK